MLIKYTNQKFNKVNSKREKFSFTEMYSTLEQYEMFFF